MKKSIIIALICIIVLVMSGCNGEYKRTGLFDVNEWISPDGVHYWADGYRMAPRYDSNGDLVIDAVE